MSVVIQKQKTLTRPVRVVHVLPDLGTGGAEQQVLVMLKKLDRRIWEPSVLCTHELGLLENDFRTADVPIECVWKKGWGDLGFFSRLVKALRKMQPDIVHTSLLSSNFWGRTAAQFLSPKPVLVASEHGVEPWRHPLVKLLDRTLARRTDLIYGVSPAVIDFLENSEGINPDKLALIYCGILPERVQGCLHWTEEERMTRRRELRIPDDTFVVGHIARPSQVKRLDVLGETIGRLHKRGVPVRLLMVGREPNETERTLYDVFLSNLRKHGAENVIVRRGFIRDMSPEYAIMDAVLQTSESEALPNVVIEAQIMERPVVATDVGGTGVMVTHRETGWLAPNEDADGLADGLEYLYTNRDDARRWAVAGRERAEKLFSADTFVQNITQTYRTLLKHRGISLPDGQPETINRET